MKTAVIFTGHTRSFVRCWPTFKWNVGRHFPDAKYFFSTIDDNDWQDALPLIKSIGMQFEALAGQPEFRSDKIWHPGQPYSHEPYAISVSPQAVLGQLWQLEQGYKLYLKNTEEKDLADVIIRVRPDSWFHSFEMLRNSSDRPELLAKWGGELQCHTPWFGKFGGVNDRFAIMGRQASDSYFFTFSRHEKLMQLGCPLHPESLIKASLEDGGVEIFDALKVEFSTLRTNGEIRFPEISMTDLVHIAMRR